MAISDHEWDTFHEQGFLRLGPLIDEATTVRLRDRADALALGTVASDEIVVQRDTGGIYEQLPSAEVAGLHPTLQYRKINGLESDDAFSQLLRLPICREIFDHLYGQHATMATFRAMVMNKPAEQGTHLPWHQDGGTVWQLDRDPLMTFWIALDDATIANGCMEVIPASHQLGLLSTFGSVVQEDDVTRHCALERRVPLEVPAGHGVLLHNWILHRSGINTTSVPRRAFTACFIDARTLNLQTGTFFPTIDGPQPSTPRFLEVLQATEANLRTSLLEAENYAAHLRASFTEAETYALDLVRVLAEREAELELLRSSVTSPEVSRPSWKRRTTK